MSRKKSSLGYLIPLVMLAILLVLIGNELRISRNPFTTKAAEGTALPPFELQNLWSADKTLTEKDLPRGQVVLLHVWGSWCSACRYEHPMMMYINNRYHIPIYSIDYKDDPEAAKTWLTQQGDPYTAIAMDPNGKFSRDLGVYGTPETFLIDKHGLIRYRHVGVIDKMTWDQEIFPLIVQYRQAD
jgi:cytochrome c biogenesis protein CcmG/thiol:disulfide interchange protein DsbE